MERRSHIDLTGAIALTAFAIMLGINQVVIKVSTGGIQPVFMAGLRSGLALIAIWLFMRYRKIPIALPRDKWGAAALLGFFFTVEFVCLYLALDLTTVSRASIIFYSMPVWLSLAAHFVLPGERLTGTKGLGLTLAMAGVAWVLADPSESGHGSLWGDFLALGAAICWGAIALVLRLTRISEEAPERQLFWQLVLSLVLLVAAAPLFGPLLRAPELIHWAGLLFQALGVASFGYLAWYVLIKMYPASGVASFSFLSPVCGVALGWLLLGEKIGVEILGGLLLVALGLFLMNKAKRTLA